MASRICLVTETYPPEINGVASTLARLASGLRARGHVVSLVRPRQPAVDVAGAPPEPGALLVGGARLPGYAGLRIGLPARSALRAASDNDPISCSWNSTCPLVGTSTAPST